MSSQNNLIGVELKTCKCTAGHEKIKVVYSLRIYNMQSYISYARDVTDPNISIGLKMYCY